MFVCLLPERLCFLLLFSQFPIPLTFHSNILRKPTIKRVLGLLKYVLRVLKHVLGVLKHVLGLVKHVLGVLKQALNQTRYTQ